MKITVDIPYRYRDLLEARAAKAGFSVMQYVAHLAVEDVNRAIVRSADDVRDLADVLLDKLTSEQVRCVRRVLGGAHVRPSARYSRSTEPEIAENMRITNSRPAAPDREWLAASALLRVAAPDSYGNWSEEQWSAALLAVRAMTPLVSTGGYPVVLADLSEYTDKSKQAAKIEHRLAVKATRDKRKAAARRRSERRA